MRTGSALAAVVALALTACGQPEPAGGALPPPSDVAAPATNDPAPPPSDGQDGPHDGPYDPAAEMRPDLMVIEPNPVDAGATVSVTFPEGTSRGVAYVLEVHIGDEWYATHFLTAAAEGYDGGPGWVAVGTEGYGWVDIGIEGPGPDTLTIPDSALAGDYRVCTANSVKNVCGELTILKVDDSPVPTTPNDIGVYVGLPLDEFTASVEPLGYTVRVVERDGESLPITDDLNPDRVNVAVVTVDGVEQVVRATDDTGVVLGEVTIEPLVDEVVPIIAVYEQVAFYPACGNETLMFEGTTWYPLNQLDGYDDEYAAVYQAFAEAEREASPVAGPRGFAPAVVAPGPGDDVGTLVVWADGVARWVSDSGDLDVWMVDDEITYTWAC